MTAPRLAAVVRGRFGFAFALAGTIWAAWLVAVAAGGGTFDAFGNLVSGDHLAFYTPARLIRDGYPETLYDYPFTAAYQNEMLGGRYRTLNAFRNPPFYALLYLPTAGLPYPASAAVWNVVSLLALVVGVRWLGVAHPWRVTAFALTFAPVFHVVGYGQNSLLSFAAFAAVYRLLATDRRFLAGLVAGLLCFKPTLLIGLVVWGVFDVRRLWPAALGVLVTAGVLVGGSYAVVPEAWAAYLGNFGEIAAYHAFDLWKVHTPRAFWALLLPDFPAAVTPLALASSLVGIGVFYRVWRTLSDPLPGGGSKRFADPSGPLPPWGGGLGWGVETSTGVEASPPPQPSPLKGEGERAFCGGGDSSPARDSRDSSAVAFPSLAVAFSTVTFPSCSRTVPAICSTGHGNCGSSNFPSRTSNRTS